jgi:hypothetical protein
MTGTETTGIVLSAASLAIQLGEIGTRLIQKSATNKKQLEADDDAFALSIRHEYRQTKLLSNVLCTKKQVRNCRNTPRRDVAPRSGGIGRNFQSACAALVKV